MNFVFFGTSAHSAHFLDIICQRGLKPDLVVSSLPKLFGRQRILTCNPTVLMAKANGLPYLENLSEIINFPPPEIGVILDFKHLINKSIIDYFQKGIINIHFSKLPAYRGASPVQYTILEGKRRAWISYFLINEKLDEGKILSQISIPLTFKETTGELYELLTEKAADEFSKILSEYLSEKIKPRQQRGKPSFAGRLGSINCRINWHWPAQKIERLIRASQPKPGAWTMIELNPPADRQNTKPKIKRLKVLKAHLEKSKLIFDQVQLEGKNQVTWKQLCEGYPKAKIVI